VPGAQALDDEVVMVGDAVEFGDAACLAAIPGGAA
jgi:hypothetical protein